MWYLGKGLVPNSPFAVIKNLSAAGWIEVDKHILSIYKYHILAIRLDKCDFRLKNMSFTFPAE